MLGTGVTHSVIKVVARVVAREVKVPFARPLLLGRSTRSGCKVDAHDEIVRVDERPRRRPEQFGRRRHIALVFAGGLM